MRFPRASLSFRLPLGFVLATVLTAGAASLTAIWIGRHAVAEQELGDSLDRMLVYGGAVQLYVDHARALLETTADLPPPRPGAADRQIAALVAGDAAVFEYVMRVGLDGAVQMLEPRALERRLSHANLSFQEWHARFVRSPGTVVSRLHISPATQRPTIVIAIPLRSERGDVSAIWAGALKLDALSRIGRGNPGASQTGWGYVTDQRGLIIAHQAKRSYVENQTDFSGEPPVREALRGGQGTLQFVSPITGRKQLAAYQPLERLGWAVAFVVPSDVALGAVRQMTRGILLASAGVTVMIGGFGVVMAHRIVSPLKQLTTASETIAAGDFGRRIEVRTGDELERLADAFNRMTSALAAKDEQLGRRADDLQAANGELEAFSYSVSHDLRAPLRAINGFSQILLEEDQAPPLSATMQRYLGLVRQNAAQMGQLIDDLLTFSRLSRQPLKRAPVAQGELISHVLEDLRAEQRGRRVEVEMAELPACDGDAALLKQVWINLLSNAFKYTRGRDPARIEIGCSASGGERIWFVKDNGVGFDTRYADKLFGVFQRLHRAEDYEGTGVGLAVVQRIVHRHGGRVWAVAEVDKGATFHFTLGPVAHPEPQERP